MNSSRFKKYYRLILGAKLVIILGAIGIGAVRQNEKLLQKNQPVPAAERSELYLDQLKGKKIALVANQTSVTHQTHLADYLFSKGITISKIFAPEHGFRGDHGAGEKVANGMDEKTGIDVVSLYGKHFKPSDAELAGLDLIVFDIQDVGVRFYTYISTLHYIMEAAAEAGIPLLILDRPNPNGMYVDGPVLKDGFKSFVGMHPVPVLHGMTMAEYAQMINGEKWLAKGVQCKLSFIQIANYTHSTNYSLPIKPSPNLPNDTAIALYPGICFFEGTVVSLGRGTKRPFQQVGYPGNPLGEHNFIPKSIAGVADHPMYENQKCTGYNLSSYYTRYLSENKGLRLDVLIGIYSGYIQSKPFFTNFFNRLAGNDILKEQIRLGLSEEQIRATWQADLAKYKETRKKYLIYE